MAKYFKILFILFFILGIITVKDFVSRSGNLTVKNSSQKEDVKTGSPSIKSAQIYFSDSIVNAEIADTPSKKELGLSFRENLDNDKGMLFILENPTIAFFWMKDMQIPLDIIWIRDNVVIDIDKDVPIPKTDTPLIQLPKYSPKEKVNYVLEVNAGFADEKGIKVGDTVTISL